MRSYGVGMQKQDKACFIGFDNENFELLLPGHPMGNLPIRRSRSILATSNSVRNIKNQHLQHQKIY
jgi:hypothetical protein